jgi:subtilisin family serine protease
MLGLIARPPAGPIDGLYADRAARDKLVESFAPPGAKNGEVQAMSDADARGVATMNRTIRHYAVLRTTPELWAIYRKGNFSEVEAYLAHQLIGWDEKKDSFHVVALPSNDVAAVNAKGEELFPERPPSRLVVALVMQDEVTAQQFQNDVQRQVREQTHGAFIGSGADLPFSGADHWCPTDARDPMFGNRAGAEQLLHIPYLRDQKKLTGSGVNVVIVDQGLNGQALGNNYAGGWSVNNNLPGATRLDPTLPRRLHAMMVANNVLRVAPDARIFDLPMVPPRITDVLDFFLHTADAAYQAVIDAITQYRKNGQYPGPWILVNAWAIYDTKSEYPPGSYTNGPLHVFNQEVVSAVNSRIDVVFCAGNCGQFCPDMRCGASDIGPGHSILGANSLDAVLTVGAVRSDAMWLGYSSQGPGQPNLGTQKPDLCAASQFGETDDAFTTNSGTSAACALTAGIVAALRSNPKWGPNQVPLAVLKSILNKTARKTDGPLWNRRTGNGILDAQAAYDQLAIQFP